MKYIVASLVAFVVLFIFAIFAVAVGWQHGGGTLVQASVFLIIATLWGAIVKNWDLIIARLRRASPEDAHTSFLDENARFTIIVSLIVIVGTGLFFALRAPRRPQGITALELVNRLRQREPARLYQYSDEQILYGYLTTFPGKYIYNSNNNKWIGDDDWRERWRNR